MSSVILNHFEQRFCNAELIVRFANVVRGSFARICCVPDGNAEARKDKHIGIIVAVAEAATFSAGMPSTLQRKRRALPLPAAASDISTRCEDELVT